MIEANVEVVDPRRHRSGSIWTKAPPAGQVNAFQTEMTAAGVEWQVITYGGVKHNFTDSDAARLDNPALEYHKLADARSGNAMAGFFKEVFA